MALGGSPCSILPRALSTALQRLLWAPPATHCGSRKTYVGKPRSLGAGHKAEARRRCMKRRAIVAAMWWICCCNTTRRWRQGERTTAGGLLLLCRRSYFFSRPRGAHWDVRPNCIAQSGFEWPPGRRGVSSAARRQSGGPGRPRPHSAAQRGALWLPGCRGAAAGAQSQGGGEGRRWLGPKTDLRAAESRR